MSGPRDQCIIEAFLAWTGKEVEIQKKTCLINILICLRKFNRLSAFFSEAPPFSNLLFSVYSLTFLFIFHKNSPLFTLDTRVAHSSTIPREKKSETHSLNSVCYSLISILHTSLPANPTLLSLYFIHVEWHLLTFSSFISYLSFSLFNHFRSAFRNLRSRRNDSFLLSLIGLSFFVSLGTRLSLVLYLNRSKSEIRVVSGDVNDLVYRSVESSTLNGVVILVSSHVPFGTTFDSPSRLARY